MRDTPDPGHWTKKEKAQRAVDAYAATLDLKVTKRMAEQAWTWPRSPKGADLVAVTRCVAVAISSDNGCVILGRHGIIQWDEGSFRLYTGSKEDRSLAGFIYTARLRQTATFFNEDHYSDDALVAKAFVEDDTSQPAEGLLEMFPVV